MATHSSIPAWEDAMDRGAWRAIVHGVAKSQPELTITATTEASSLLWPCHKAPVLGSGV